MTWQNLETDAIEKATLTSFSHNLNHYSSVIKTTQTTFWITIFYNQQGIVKEFTIKDEDGLLFNGINQGNWLINGDFLETNEAIHFIDISLTPFTNKLPIDYLIYHEEQEIISPILFIDIENQKIAIYHQKYSIIEETVLYQNIETKYSNKLKIDSDHLVLDYPGVFKLITTEKL